MPLLTVVIGAPGSGKTNWCDDNGRFLPDLFYEAEIRDAASPAFNDPKYAASARAALDAHLEQRLERGDDFGVSTGYFDMSRPALIRRAVARGYSVNGIYLGTSSARVNFLRLVKRQSISNAPHVSYENVMRRRSACQDNLVATARDFIHLAILDFSTDLAVPLARVAGQRVLREVRPLPPMGGSVGGAHRTPGA